MKNVLKLALVALAIFALGSTSTLSAQKKSGYINLQELMTLMPEWKTAGETLAALEAENAELLASIEKEAQNKYAELESTRSTLTATMVEYKENEIRDLQVRYQEQQAVGGRKLQAEEARLLEPIFKKANEAVAAVGRANGFGVVYEAGALRFYDDTFVDVLPLAKKHLGIQ